MSDEMNGIEKTKATLDRYRERFLAITRMEKWDGKAGDRYKIESMINSWCILCFIDQISGGADSIGEYHRFAPSLD